eukprot:gene7889-16148_t
MSNIDNMKSVFWIVLARIVPRGSERIWHFSTFLLVLILNIFPYLLVREANSSTEGSDGYLDLLSGSKYRGALIASIFSTIPILADVVMDFLNSKCSEPISFTFLPREEIFFFITLPDILIFLVIIPFKQYKILAGLINIRDSLIIYAILRYIHKLAPGIFSKRSTIFIVMDWALGLFSPTLYSDPKWSLLEHDISSDNLLETLEEISLSCNIAVDTLSEMLTFDKVESNNMNLDKTVFGVNKFIKECLRPFYLQAEANNVQLVTIFDELTDSNDLMISADEHKLSQVLRNLMSNALKFTQTNGIVTVRISHEICVDEGMLTGSSGFSGISTSSAGRFEESLRGLKAYVKVEVIDTGAGISLVS